MSPTNMRSQLIGKTHDYLGVRWQAKRDTAFRDGSRSHPSLTIEKRRRRCALSAHSMDTRQHDGGRIGLMRGFPWSAVASEARHRFGDGLRGQPFLTIEKRRRRYALPAHSKGVRRVWIWRPR